MNFAQCHEISCFFFWTASLSRKERNSKLKQMNENESPISLPFVPKCVNDLKVGFNVRVISNSGQVGNAVVK